MGTELKLMTLKGPPGGRGPVSKSEKLSKATLSVAEEKKRGGSLIGNLKEKADRVGDVTA